jgi:hypothetical protein
VDPTDAAHVLQTPDEYADFLGRLSFDKRIEMIDSFRCAELQGAEELRVLAETVEEPEHITIGGRLIVDTLNDIEEILPRRGETVGLDRVIPILTLFQAVESRALVSFEAHRRAFAGADPAIAELIGKIIADESHHAGYVRKLLDRWAQEGWADAVREAQEATDAREERARAWAAERLEAERMREEGERSPT